MRVRHAIQKHGLRVILLLIFVLGWTTCVASTPATNVLPPDALLSDDFSTNGGIWALFDTSEGAAYIQQGEFYLEDRGQGIGVYSQLVRPRWEDLIVSLRLRQVEGTQDNWMGVICRQQDEENYYLLAISADGYYLIMKTEAGMPTSLVGPERSDAIEPGRATNVMEARCDGETLALRVNDELLASTEDGSFEEGAIALFADGVAGQRTIVAFDNLVVLEP